MDKSILLSLIVILIVTCYYINNEIYIEDFWGFRSVFRRVKRYVPTPRKVYRAIKKAPKKIYKTVKKSPKKLLKIVKNPIKSVKSVGSYAKKKSSSTFNKIAGLTKKIANLASKVKDIDKVFSGIKNKFNGIKDKISAVGGVFKSVFGITKEGFDLLKDAIKMLIEIAQILYLVVDKMYKCNDGMEEVAREVKRELNIIVRGLMRLQNRVYNCVTFQYGFSKEHYEKCIKSLFSMKLDIMFYVRKIDILLKNPRLFPQDRNTKYGESKAYCRNARSGKNFAYSKKCNQCFNIYGLLAKGNKQLLGVMSLMNNSEDLFRELAKLKRNIDRIF
jgi:hypothetical protein